MKFFVSVLALGSATLAGWSIGLAQEVAEMPEMPTPQKEHEWLQQFVGEWDSEAEASMGPDQPVVKSKSVQHARMLGGFWMISEGNGEMAGQRMQTMFTLGYDSQKQKYVGTWIDSCTGHLWQYVGTVEGNVLTLDTEGPNFMSPGSTSKYREVIEFRSDDHYVFTSAAADENGEWVTYATANFHRRK